MQDIMPFIQHHLLLNIALVVILFILMVIEFIKQKRSAASASPAQVTQLINRVNANVVDIRSTTLFAEGHIIGALSVPIAELTEGSKKLEKLRAQPLVIVCATGLESTRAADLLMKQGFDVRILAGGLRAWREADMPLVKG
jgi:rhodanese-related sulfurtransferase